MDYFQDLRSGNTLVFVKTQKAGIQSWGQQVIVTLQMGRIELTNPPAVMVGPATD